MSEPEARDDLPDKENTPKAENNREEFDAREFEAYGDRQDRRRTGLGSSVAAAIAYWVITCGLGAGFSSQRYVSPGTSVTLWLVTTGCCFGLAVAFDSVSKRGWGHTARSAVCIFANQWAVRALGLDLRKSISSIVVRIGNIAGEEARYLGVIL